MPANQNAKQSDKQVDFKELTENDVDAIEFLEDQHREVEALFKDIESAGGHAQKKKEMLFKALAEKLGVHIKIEETIFYPAIAEVDEGMVLEAFEEHANVKAMIRKLQKTEGSDKTFDAKVKVLKELVEHHVKEEEQDLFPKCRKIVGAELLCELGAQLQQKFNLMNRSH